MEPDPNTPAQEKSKFPDGFENWSLGRKEAFLKGEPEEIMPSNLFPEQEQITEAFGENGEKLEIGITVFWNLAGASGSGRVISFERKKGSDKIFASVDADNGSEVEIETENLTLTENGNLNKAGLWPVPNFENNSPQPTPTPQTPEEQTTLEQQIMPPNPPLQQEGGSKEEPKIVGEVPKENVENILEPEWKKGEEWEKFEKLRNTVAQAEAKSKKEKREMTDLEAIATQQYQSQRYDVAYKIGDSLRTEIGVGPLTSEQEAELKSKTNNVLFEELVKKENDAYLSALKEARGEGLVDKVLEGTKNLLGTKAFQWYLGLDRKQRMLVSFGVGGLAGLAFVAGPGMIGAITYLGWRAARVGLSGVAGAAAGEWSNKRWSAEELKAKEEKELADLKNSNLSLEEKSKGLIDIEKRYRKEKIKMNLKKMGTTIAAGAGAGILTGLAEHTVMGVGGATKSALETNGKSSGVVDQNKLPPRKGFEPSVAKNPSMVDRTLDKIKPVEPLPVKPPAPVVPTSEQINTLNAKIYAENQPVEPVEPAIAKVGKIFEDPKVLTHEVVAGDSAWKILEKTLDNNEQFKGLTEAQKTYVLSTLTNKALQNPQEYGLGDEGALHIGDKTDFTKLFEDTKEIRSILEKAKQTIAENSPQEKSILANNEKIASWVKENPEAKLTNDKVSEILATKPKTEAPITEIYEDQVPGPEPDVSVTMESSKPVFSEDLVVENAVKPQTGANQEQLINEIAEAKKRLGVLEEEKSGLRTMAGDTSMIQEIEKAFNTEIDNIYGHKGWLGMGKIDGVSTKEWGFMKGLPAGKVLEYFRDPESSSLPKNVLQELGTSEKHRGLVEQVTNLMDEAYQKAQVDFKPFDNGEKMEAFIKRLGAFLMKQSK